MIPDILAQQQLWIDIVTVLLGQVLKAAVVFASGYLLVTLRRRASAAQHNLVLRLAFTAALILPLLSLFTPQWDLALGTSISRVWYTGAVTYSISEAAQVPAEESGFIAAWQFWVLLTWATGALLILLHLGLGLAVTVGIARGGRPITDPRALRIVDALRQRLHIGRPVSIVSSPRITTPFTWGIFKPRIILPEQSERWHPREMRFVLLHELAHVKRLDALWYIFASATAAMYWINPVVWIVKKRLIIESEKTCDDYVICAGSDGMAYAQHLLLILRSIRPGHAIGPVGVGMARRSHMEGRLMSILSNRQRSTTLKRSLVIWVTVLTLLTVFPLAGLSLSAPQQGKEKDKAGSVIDEKLPAPDEFIPVDSGPTLTNQQAPEYPKEARKEGIMGTVMVKALIDKEGKVRKAVVDESSGHKILDDAALKAAYLNEYKPAMQKDKPVAVWVKYNVDFKLDGKKKESTGG